MCPVKTERALPGKALHVLRIQRFLDSPKALLLVQPLGLAIVQMVADEPVRVKPKKLRYY